MNKKQQESMDSEANEADFATMSNAPTHRCNISTEENVGQNVGRYSFDFTGHVHRLDGKPLMGTSTVVQVLGKPLTWWAAGMALTPLGWLNKRKSNNIERCVAASRARDKISPMTHREYSDFLEECYRAHNTKKETAAVSGTSMHKALETYVDHCLTYNDGVPERLLDYDHIAVAQFSSWSLEHVKKFLWSEGHCYSERLWTGGISDCGALLHEGSPRTVAVIDFKSSKEAYWDQFIQVGGYALQIEENGLYRANGTVISTAIRQLPITALIVVPFGGTCGSQIRKDVDKFKSSFQSTVQLHKHKQEFEP